MFDLPFFYKKETLKDTSTLLSALYLGKPKVFNASLEIKLKQGKSIKLLELVFNNAVKQKNNEVALSIIKKINNELKSRTYEAKGLYFIKLLKSVLKSDNGILFNDISRELTDSICFYSQKGQVNELYTIAVDLENGQAISTILNSRIFCWTTKTIYENNIFVSNVLKLISNGRIDLCRYVINSSMFLANDYSKVIPAIRNFALKIGDLSIFEKTNDQINIILAHDQKMYYSALMISLENNHIENFGTIIDMNLKENFTMHLEEYQINNIFEKIAESGSEKALNKIMSVLSSYKLYNQTNDLDYYQEKFLNFILKANSMNLLSVLITKFGTRFINKKSINMSLLTDSKRDILIEYILSFNSNSRMNFLGEIFEKAKLQRKIASFN